jgi:hypothetical protein
VTQVLGGPGSDGRAMAAVLAQPTLVDAIRARIAGRLDALAFAIAVAPRDNFALDMADISPLTDVRAAELADVLAGCGQVTHLGLAFASALTDGGVAHLARLRSLRSLELAGSTSLTDDCVRFLWRLTALTSLGLANSPVTDAGLAAVAQLTALRRLDILGCEAVTAAGIAHLSSLVGLTSLRTPRAFFFWNIEEPEVAAGCLEAHALAPVLRRLPALKDLAAPPGGQASLALAGRLGALRYLDVGNCDISDWRLVASNLPGLTTLRFGFRFGGPETNPLAAPDVSHLCRGLTALRELTLRLVKFEDGALDGLAALGGGLRQLEFAGAAVKGGATGGEDPGGLRLGTLLPALTGLTSLYFCDVFLCDADVIAIARHLPNLTDLFLPCDGITAAALAELSSLSALTTLLMHEEDAEEDGVSGDGGAGLGAALAGIAAGAPLLRDLAIVRVEAGVDLCALRALSALSYLDIAATTGHALATLPALRGGRLTSLHLDGPISDAGLSAVAALSQLLYLEIDASACPGGVDDAIGDAGLAALRDGLPRLKKLKLRLQKQGDGTRVSDAGLAAICALPALRRLTLALGATPAVTAAGVERVQQLPALVRLKRGGLDHCRLAVDKLYLPWT